MSEKKVQCPHCNEIFKLDLPEATPDELQPIIREQLEELINKAKLPGNLDHRHKTADDFLDCPECRPWFDNTAKRYQIVEKEPPAPAPGEKPGEKKPGDKKPEDQPGDKKPGEKEPAAPAPGEKPGEKEKKPGDKKPEDQPGDKKPGEKEPAATQPALGSIFSTKQGGEHEQ